MHCAAVFQLEFEVVVASVRKLQVKALFWCDHVRNPV